MHFNDLLEIGYGSGIFLPTLSRFAEHLYGLDIHPDPAIVDEMLAKEGVHADLQVGSLLDMNYSAGKFDGVVCLSVLEHLKPLELERALSEIDRISKRGAIVILGFPGKNIFNNLFYRMVGFQEDDLHPSGHSAILQAIRNRMKLTSVLKYPSLMPSALTWYWVCRAEMA